MQSQMLEGEALEQQRDAMLSTWRPDWASRQGLHVITCQPYPLTLKHMPVLVRVFPCHVLLGPNRHHIGAYGPFLFSGLATLLRDPI